MSTFQIFIAPTWFSIQKLKKNMETQTTSSEHPLEKSHGVWNNLRDFVVKAIEETI